MGHPFFLETGLFFLGGLQLEALETHNIQSILCSMCKPPSLKTQTSGSSMSGILGPWDESVPAQGRSPCVSHRKSGNLGVQSFPLKLDTMAPLAGLTLKTMPEVHYYYAHCTRKKQSVRNLIWTDPGLEARNTITPSPRPILQSFCCCSSSSCCGCLFVCLFLFSKRLGLVHACCATV